MSAPLVPLRQQRLIGAPKYDPAEYPTTECAIRATSGFTGTGAVQLQQRAGRHVESLCLLGKGQTVSGGLNGIDMGVSTSGEAAWAVVFFSAFNGCRDHGMWVGDILDRHTGLGTASRPTASEGWTDVRIIGHADLLLHQRRHRVSTAPSAPASVTAPREKAPCSTYGNPAGPVEQHRRYPPGQRNNIELIGV